MSKANCFLFCISFFPPRTFFFCQKAFRFFRLILFQIATRLKRRGSNFSEMFADDVDSLIQTIRSSSAAATGDRQRLAVLASSRSSSGFGDHTSYSNTAPTADYTSAPEHTGRTTPHSSDSSSFIHHVRRYDAALLAAPPYTVVDGGGHLTVTSVWSPPPSDPIREWTEGSVPVMMSPAPRAATVTRAMTSTTMVPPPAGSYQYKSVHFPLSVTSPPVTPASWTAAAAPMAQTARPYGTGLRASSSLAYDMPSALRQYYDQVDDAFGPPSGSSRSHVAAPDMFASTGGSRHHLPLVNNSPPPTAVSEHPFMHYHPGATTTAPSGFALSDQPGGGTAARNNRRAQVPLTRDVAASINNGAQSPPFVSGQRRPTISSPDTTSRNAAPRNAASSSSRLLSSPDFAAEGHSGHHHMTSAYDGRGDAADGGGSAGSATIDLSSNVSSSNDEATGNETDSRNGRSQRPLDHRGGDGDDDDDERRRSEGDPHLYRIEAELRQLRQRTEDLERLRSPAAGDKAKSTPANAAEGIAHRDEPLRRATSQPGVVEHRTLPEELDAAVRRAESARRRNVALEEEADWDTLLAGIVEVRFRPSTKVLTAPPAPPALAPSAPSRESLPSRRTVVTAPPPPTANAAVPRGTSPRTLTVLDITFRAAFTDLAAIEVTKRRDIETGEGEESHDIMSHEEIQWAQVVELTQLRSEISIMQSRQQHKASRAAADSVTTSAARVRSAPSEATARTFQVETTRQQSAALVESDESRERGVVQSDEAVAYAAVMQREIARWEFVSESRTMRISAAAAASSAAVTTSSPSATLLKDPALSSRGGVSREAALLRQRAALQAIVRLCDVDEPFHREACSHEEATAWTSVLDQEAARWDVIIDQLEIQHARERRDGGGSNAGAAAVTSSQVVRQQGQPKGRLEPHFATLPVHHVLIQVEGQERNVIERAEGNLRDDSVSRLIRRLLHLATQPRPEPHLTTPPSQRVGGVGIPYGTYEGHSEADDVSDRSSDVDALRSMAGEAKPPPPSTSPRGSRIREQSDAANHGGYAPPPRTRSLVYLPAVATTSGGAEFVDHMYMLFGQLLEATRSVKRALIATIGNDAMVPSSRSHSQLLSSSVDAAGRCASSSWPLSDPSEASRSLTDVITSLRFCFVLCGTVHKGAFATVRNGCHRGMAKLSSSTTAAATLPSALTGVFGDLVAALSADVRSGTQHTHHPLTGAPSLVSSRSPSPSRLGPSGTVVSVSNNNRNGFASSRTAYGGSVQVAIGEHEKIYRTYVNRLQYAELCLALLIRVHQQAPDAALSKDRVLPLLAQVVAHHQKIDMERKSHREAPRTLADLKPYPPLLTELPTKAQRRVMNAASPLGYARLCEIFFDEKKVNELRSTRVQDLLSCLTRGLRDHVVFSVCRSSYMDLDLSHSATATFLQAVRRSHASRLFDASALRKTGQPHIVGGETAVDDLSGNAKPLLEVLEDAFDDLVHLAELVVETGKLLLITEREVGYDAQTVNVPHHMLPEDDLLLAGGTGGGPLPRHSSPPQATDGPGHSAAGSRSTSVHQMPNRVHMSSAASTSSHSPSRMNSVTLPEWTAMDKGVALERARLEIKGLLETVDTLSVPSLAHCDEQRDGPAIVQLANQVLDAHEDVLRDLLRALVRYDHAVHLIHHFPHEGERSSTTDGHHHSHGASAAAWLAQLLDPLVLHAISVAMGAYLCAYTMLVEGLTADVARIHRPGEGDVTAVAVSSKLAKSVSVGWVIQPSWLASMCDTSLVDLTHASAAHASASAAAWRSLATSGMMVLVHPDTVGFGRSASGSGNFASRHPESDIAHWSSGNSPFARLYLRTKAQTLPEMDASELLPALVIEASRDRKVTIALEKLLSVQAQWCDPANTATRVHALAGSMTLPEGEAWIDVKLTWRGSRTTTVEDGATPSPRGGTEARPSPSSKRQVTPVRRTFSVILPSVAMFVSLYAALWQLLPVGCSKVPRPT